MPENEKHYKVITLCPPVEIGEYTDDGEYFEQVLEKEREREGGNSFQ